MSKYITPPRFLATRPNATGTIAGAGAQIPVIYGIDRRQALISSVTDAGDKIIFVCIWSVGEIDGITGFTLNDKPFPVEAGYALRHYLGEPGQGVDAGLKAVRSDYDDTLTMTLAGQPLAIAYSVVEIPSTVEFPVLAATIRGRKVYDPRSNTTAWSDNPALCLADYIQSPTYGQGWPVAGVAEAANACDEMVGGQHRRTVGISVNDGRDVNRERWVESLREYAKCFVVPEGAYRKLVPDRPSASVATVEAVPDTLKIAVDQTQPVTVSRVKWKDTSGLPWRDAWAVAYALGVKSGEVEWVEAQIDLGGIHHGPQALREASERLAAASVASVSVEFLTYDIGLVMQAGDVVTIDEPGASGLFRITSISSNEPGLYRVSAVAYSDSMFSDSTADSAIIPPPVAPRSDSINTPNIGGVTSGGGTYVAGADGTIFNRIRVDLAPPADSPDFARFEVRFRRKGSADPWQTGEVTGTTAYLYPVQDGVQYEFDTRAVGRMGAVSDWVASTHTVEKKNVPPPAPTGLDVSVAASGTRTVSFSYTNPPADLAGFRIQYDSGDGYVDLLDGLTSRQSIETEKMPAGDVTIRVHAQDNSKNTSGWVYKTSNIEQGADGKWYDVDARIAAESSRNDTQDGSIEYHGNVQIPDARNRADGAQNSANNIQFSVIPPIDTRATDAQNTGNDLRFNVIPPIDSRSSDAQNTGNDLRFNVIPPIDSTATAARNDGNDLRYSVIPPISSAATDGRNTAINLRDTVIPPISSTANDGQNRATDAQNRLPPVESGVDFSNWKIPVIEEAAGNAQDSANNAQGTANTANGTANRVDNDVNGNGGLRFVSGDAKATADSALSRANQAYAEAQAGGIDGSRLIPNTITYDRLNILNLGSISANIGTVTAGLLRSSSGAAYVDLDGSSGHFMVAGGDKVVIDHSGVVYAKDIYIWGTWRKRASAGVEPAPFVGYKKIDDVLGDVMDWINSVSQS